MAATNSREKKVIIESQHNKIDLFWITHPNKVVACIIQKRCYVCMFLLIVFKHLLKSIVLFFFELFEITNSNEKFEITNS